MTVCHATCCRREPSACGGGANTPLLALYFFNGAAQSLPVSSLSLILAVQLHGSDYPALVNRFYGGLLLGSGLAKPFLGGVADTMRIGRKRRVPALVFANLLWAAMLLAVGCLSKTIITYFCAYVLLMVATSFNETVLDAISVETMRRQSITATDIQGAAFLMRSMGSLAASGTSFFLVQSTPDIASVVVVSAAIPFFAAFVSCFIKEGPLEISPSSRNCASLCNTWNAITRMLSENKPQFALIVLFLFLRNSLPSVDDTWGLYVATAFEADFYTLLTFLTSVGGVVGLIATRPLRSLSLQKLIVATTLMNALAGGGLRFFLFRTSSSYEKVEPNPEKWLYGACAIALGAFGTASFLPLLALCAVLAPPGAEAAGFALMAFAIDVGDQVGAQFSAVVVDLFSLGSGKGQSWDNFGMYVIVCAALSLVPICLVPWLKFSQSEGSAASCGVSERQPLDSERQDQGPVIEFSSDELP